MKWLLKPEIPCFMCKRFMDFPGFAPSFLANAKSSRIMLSYLLLPLPASSKTSSAVSSLGEVAEFAFQHQLSWHAQGVLTCEKKWPKPLLHRKGFDCHNCRHPCIRPADWNIHPGIPKNQNGDWSTFVYHATNKGNIDTILMQRNTDNYACSSYGIIYVYIYHHMCISSYEKDRHSCLTCSTSVWHWQFT